MIPSRQSCDGEADWTRELKGRQVLRRSDLGTRTKSRDRAGGALFCWVCYFQRYLDNCSGVGLSDGMHVLLTIEL